jgi:hypothetical protein
VFAKIKPESGLGDVVHCFYRKVIYKYTRKSEMGALPPPETSDDDTKLQ